VIGARIVTLQSVAEGRTATSLREQKARARTATVSVTLCFHRCRNVSRRSCRCCDRVATCVQGAPAYRIARPFHAGVPNIASARFLPGAERRLLGAVADHPCARSKVSASVLECLCSRVPRVPLFSSASSARSDSSDSSDSRRASARTAGCDLMTTNACCRGKHALRSMGDSVREHRHFVAVERRWWPC
jgi:hypothetical protein